MPENKNRFILTLSAILKGIGQIMLQENYLSGLLILIGICCSSFLMSFVAIVGVTAGTLIAKLLKYDNAEINAGLYGFSATLVALAVAFFFKLTIITWIVIITASPLATIFQHYFIKRKFPAFTFPFIAITWLFLIVLKRLSLPLNEQAAALTSLSNIKLFPLSFAQVILQENVWSGILFFMSILVSNPVAAIQVIFSVAISSILAYALGESLNDIYIGLLSYNAILCSIVFAGKRLSDMTFVLISVILSVVITILMRHLQLLPLTFPFVLATWLILIIKK